MPRRTKNDGESALAVAGHIIKMFGPAPLLSSESPEKFRRLLAGLILDMKPTDLVMRMLVFEFAVFLWDAMRLRRYKTVTIEQARLDAAMEVAREFLGDADPNSAADLLKDGTPLRQKLLAALAERHLSIDDVIDGRAYHDTANINDKIEAQLSTLHARRSSVLREHEAYRERAVRKVSDNIIDVDPEEDIALAPPVNGKHQVS
jgi:hypothetical protein